MHRIKLLSVFLLFSCLELSGTVELKHRHLIKGRGDNPIEFTLNDSAGRPVSLSQYRGKFVIICMMANWCKPCLSEIVPTRALQQDFLGRNIVWIFISFDREKGDWDESRKVDNLKGVHLWGKPKSEELKKTFNFNSLPYYTWIDPNGLIAVEDAPRPSVHSSYKQLKLFVQ